jgi:hypothetical protein
VERRNSPPAAADGREHLLACGRGSRLFLAGYASVKAIFAVLIGLVAVVSRLLPGPLSRFPFNACLQDFADAAGQDRSVASPPGRTYPLVADVAVLSVPDDRWSEQVAGFARPALGHAAT